MAVHNSQMTTGVACATLPTSSSFCMIRLIRAWTVDGWTAYLSAGGNDPGFKLHSEQTESICQEKRTTGNLVVLFLFFILRRLAVVVVVVVVQVQEQGVAAAIGPTLAAESSCVIRRGCNIVTFLLANTPMVKWLSCLPSICDKQELASGTGSIPVRCILFLQSIIFFYLIRAFLEAYFKGFAHPSMSTTTKSRNHSPPLTCPVTVLLTFSSSFTFGHQ